MTGEEFTELLVHAGYYDPVRAHDYYLRTRQLKGRRPGSRQPVTEAKNGFNGSPANGRARPHAEAKPSAKELRARAEQRTEELKTRIEHLKTVLERLVKEAKARSGVKTLPKHDAQKPSPSQKQGQKPVQRHETQKEKEARQRYEKQHRQPSHQKPSRPKTDEQLQNQIEQLTEKIRAIRRQLKNAVNDARVHPRADGGSGRSSIQPRSR